MTTSLQLNEQSLCSETLLLGIIVQLGFQSLQGLLAIIAFLNDCRERLSLFVIGISLEGQELVAFPGICHWNSDFIRLLVTQKWLLHVLESIRCELLLPRWEQSTIGDTDMLCCI